MKARTENNQNPTSLWKHLEEIIKTHIRPLLQDHGGDIIIREICGKDVRVALLGNCKGCPAAQITIDKLYNVYSQNKWETRSEMCY